MPVLLSEYHKGSDVLCGVREANTIVHRLLPRDDVLPRDGDANTGTEDGVESTYGAEDQGPAQGCQVEAGDR